MTTVTYSLDEFVHDMNVLIDDKADTPVQEIGDRFV